VLEQEIASVIQFTLANAGIPAPAPYYYEVPEGFIVPSVYFPVPEVASGGWTLSDYALTYAWFIKFFHRDRQGAYDNALAVLNAIKERRGSIPLIGVDGAPIGRGFRVKHSEIKSISGEFGAAQLYLSWESARPYLEQKAEKMMEFELNILNKAAFAAASGQPEPGGGGP